MKQYWNTDLDYNGSENKEGTLGQLRWLPDGRVFRWIKANGNIAKGEVVAAGTVISPAEDADVDAAAAAGTNLLVANGDFANDDYGPGWFVYIDAGAGAGQLREIDCVVDDNTIRIKGTWDTALDNTSDYIIFSPFYVRKADVSAGDGLIPVGIAQNAISDGNYGWVQVQGIGVALMDGTNGDTLKEGEKCIVSASADGKVEGFSGSTTADEAANTIGHALAGVDADQLVPIWIDLLK